MADSSQSIISELEALRRAGIKVNVRNSHRPREKPAKTAKAKPHHSKPPHAKPKPKPKAKPKHGGPGSEHKTIRSKTGVVLHGAARHARMKALAKKRAK